MAALLELCRFRDEHPAFDGPASVELDGSRLVLARRGAGVADAWASLQVDLASGAARIDRGHGDASGSWEDVLATAGGGRA